MSNQRGFKESVPNIVNANEPHMALVLLLDTSASMGVKFNNGETPIKQLNLAVNRFKEEVCEDKLTRSILDIAIVEFNTDYHPVQPFVPIEQMKPVNLVATGTTNMAPAVEEALRMIDERVRFYKRTTEPYKPWIVMISDGYSSGVEDVAAKVQQLIAADKLQFWSLGVEGYDSKLLHMFSERVMKLNGYDFHGFFDWMNKSMRAISVSSPGENPRLDNLPDNVDKDKDPNVW